MKLFGADPKELDEVYRKLYKTEMDLGIVRHEYEAAQTENELLRSRLETLDKEYRELQDVSLKLKAELLKAPRDPFAGWPAELKKLIDYQALGMEEPE
jgi:uncharacterized protein (DUF3084 family)